tara:strand:+ start:487 stop:930 length:444 start_codon:yes stop_codon:yes gene_type:complete
LKEKKYFFFLSSILIYILLWMSEKIKYELEFPIQASPNMLYQYITSASSLSEWFADNVNSRGKVFSFFWDGSEEKAELISKNNNQFVKFRWLEEEDDYYFQIRIVVDELTKDVSLMITDFSYEDEVEESKMLWESQIADLKQVLGSS